MRYFEDFEKLPVGTVIQLGSRSIDQEAIIAFARDYDPQVFHVDHQRAQQSHFGGLVASGWQTAGIYMRLAVDAVWKDAASMGSPGIEDLRWPNPVRPGDVLSGRLTLSSTRRSNSRPTMGLLTFLADLANQREELVITFKGIIMLEAQPGGL